MPVDLSGVLRAQFEEARKAYEKALREHDGRLASQMAAKCARVLGLLAENIPQEKNFYLEKAAKWEEVARQIKEKGIREVKETEERQPPEVEFREYIEGLISTSPVTWDDIGGLEEPKRLLQETVVIAAMKKPESIKPWTGILLYGPPGTGKTLLAAAAAGSLRATFFNASADKVLSKYYGESSRLIAALYEVAMEKAPSIVFIDEIDALALARSEEISEASRRTLSTLLTCLDGFKGKKSPRLVLTLTATNMPWALDSAILSRFPRRIYVPLPDARAAEEIIKLNTRGLDISALALGQIAKECVVRRFSGREVAYLCQEAVWHMVREENPNLPQLSSLPFEEIRERSLKVRPLKEADFRDALSKIKTSLSSEVLAKYKKWAQE